MISLNMLYNRNENTLIFAPGLLVQVTDGAGSCLRAEDWPARTSDRNCVCGLAMSVASAV